VKTALPGEPVATGAVQRSDGSIVVVAGGYLLGVQSDGSVDATFGSSGVVILPMFATCVLLQPDGKLVTGGSYYTGQVQTARFNGDGRSTPRMAMEEWPP
jgi:hypothetical protein